MALYQLSAFCHQNCLKIGSQRGEKTELITRSIEKIPGEFRVADIQRNCPGVSMDMIRRVLKSLREKKQIECLGRAQNDQWRKTKKWELGNAR